MTKRSTVTALPAARTIAANGDRRRSGRVVGGVRREDDGRWRMEKA